MTGTWPQAWTTQDWLWVAAVLLVFVLGVILAWWSGGGRL